MRVDGEIKCRLLWSLARRHGWASPVDATTLVSSALPTAEQGMGRELLGALAREPYVDRVGESSYALRNDPDSQAVAAARLTDTCGYTTLQVEATLSRFAQAGGFSAYDRSRLREALPDWD